MKQKILERFLRYVKIDTQSDETSNTTPSTEKQFDLARVIEAEMKEIGLEDISLDDKCYLMGTLPSNTDKEVSTIGFIAHFDTAQDMSGANVKPRIVENYDGGDIVLNEEKQIILTPTVFPELKEKTGQTLVVTDGTTLLGADDKAGIAEIITAVDFLKKNPSIKHGKIRIAFTPDEEIGRGMDHFDVKKFGADFAYTLDGADIGELEFENFNAAKAVIKIQGRNVHPGYAKDKMLNSILIGMELNSLLPVNQRPEYTSGYEGFFHIIKMESSVESGQMVYIIRDHDRKKFEDKKVLMQKAVEYMQHRYGEDVVKLELTDQYYNMREKVEERMEIVELAKKAMEIAAVEPKIVPIRGGTDGSRLSYMGVLCPNLFAGGMNFHGKFEYIPVETMEKSVEVILNIIKLNAEK